MQPNKLMIFKNQYEPERKLSAKELMFLNSGVGEDPWESLGLQDQTSQS